MPTAHTMQDCVDWVLTQLNFASLMACLCEIYLGSLSKDKKTALIITIISNVSLGAARIMKVKWTGLWVAKACLRPTARRIECIICSDVIMVILYLAQQVVETLILRRIIIFFYLDLKRSWLAALGCTSASDNRLIRCRECQFECCRECRREVMPDTVKNT
ncbi:hypothetical protein Btru_077483 [Bulinus truncatus]|nr:hypothetical protein Btru_077483 [Bulinus truncatus]